MHHIDELSQDRGRRFFHGLFSSSSQRDWGGLSCWPAAARTARVHAQGTCARTACPRFYARRWSSAARSFQLPDCANGSGVRDFRPVRPAVRMPNRSAHSASPDAVCESGHSQAQGWRRWALGLITGRRWHFGATFPRRSPVRPLLWAFLRIALPYAAAGV